MVMRRPGSMRALEALGRVRLSRSFYFRDFLYSEIAAFYRLANIPDDPDLAIEAGSRLCQALLEPTFGAIAIRSAYRSLEVNEFGNKHALNCAPTPAVRPHLGPARRRSLHGRDSVHRRAVVRPIVTRQRGLAADGGGSSTTRPRSSPSWRLQHPMARTPETAHRQLCRAQGCLTRPEMAGRDDHAALYAGPCCRDGRARRRP